MAEDSSGPDWQLSRRDRIILAELSNDPTLSSADLREILEEEYAISASRVTISESIRQMREADVFREVIVPNEDYLLFSLFEYQFFPPNFEDNWRDAFEYIRDDEHTLMFYLADGTYWWHSVMMFADREEESRWLHEFYKDHGDLLIDLRTTVISRMLKFGTDPKVFQSVMKD